jgi:hypothetical protein
MDAQTRPLPRADALVAAALAVAMAVAAVATGPTGLISGLGTAVVAAGSSPS